MSVQLCRQEIHTIFNFDLSAKLFLASKIIATVCIICSPEPYVFTNVSLGCAYGIWSRCQQR